MTKHVNVTNKKTVKATTKAQATIKKPEWPPKPDFSFFSQLKNRQGNWITIPSDNHKQQYLARKTKSVVPEFKVSCGEIRVSTRNQP